jgi:hypothetical protein
MCTDLTAGVRDIAVVVCYLFNSFGFKFVTVGSYFLGHDKLLLLCLVYQVYLYGLFSIAHTSYSQYLKAISSLTGWLVTKPLRL